MFDSGIGGLEEGGVRRTLPDGCARVTAVGASVLLHVQRATTLKVYQYPIPRLLNLPSAIIPQRLHRTCVLLWRFPKLDVPFAIHALQSASNVSSYVRGVRRRMRTHFVGIWRGSLVGSIDIVVARCKVFKACLDVQASDLRSKVRLPSFRKVSRSGAEV